MRWAALPLFVGAAILTGVAIASMGGCRSALNGVAAIGAGVCLSGAVILVAPREYRIGAVIFGVLAGVLLGAALLAAGIFLWVGHCAN